MTSGTSGRTFASTTRATPTFYTPFFVSGSEPAAGNRAAEASADYRLAEMTSFTIGLELGKDNVERPWSVSLEYYLQSVSEPGGKFGELRNQELGEDVSALYLRFNMDL